MCTEQFIEVFCVQKNASCDFSVVSLVYVVQCGVCSKMLVVQWGAIYHPPRHTCPFVTIPKSPSSSSSLTSIQAKKSVKIQKKWRHQVRAYMLQLHWAVFWSVNICQRTYSARNLIGQGIISHSQAMFGGESIRWHAKFYLYFNFHFHFVQRAFLNVIHGMRQFYFHFFILYLVSRAFTWHAAMFGLGYDRGSSGSMWWRHERQGLRLCTHTKLRNCVQTTIMHNCELWEIVQTGWDFVRTHCKPCRSAHVIVSSHISGMSYILFKKVLYGLWETESKI